MKVEKKFIIFTVIMVIICGIVVLGMYFYLKPQVVAGDKQLKTYFDNKVDTSEKKCENIIIRIPADVEEFIKGIGLKYKSIEPNNYEESPYTWVENEKYLDTPYEHTHWFLGYTENGIPVIFKYSDITKINTNSLRTAVASDSNAIMDWCYYCIPFGDLVILNGKLGKTKVNVKFLGELDKKVESDSQLDNYLINGKDIDCIFIYADKIYN